MLRADQPQANPTRPRFVVRNKPARKNPGPCWAVVDRLRGRVHRRFVYRASADQVAQELNEASGPIPANPRSDWPDWTAAERWTLVEPVPPAEIEDRDEVDPADRAWWREQDAEFAEADPLLAEIGSPLSAFLDRVGPGNWEEADLIEFAR